jgi:carbon-monoxide dehydrogenase small subunit
MSRVALTVNGKPVAAEVDARTHLADFLRDELLLTGTHLGCEHGVCGACTLLIDGAPARSCIAFAVACDGTDIRTIEGLEDDPLVAALRAAFTAEHALQCGYCTPGMLVTARDIVQRLPHADEARIRLELAGNLCRCTGYAGIVRAIRRVLAGDAVAPPARPEPVPAMTAMPVAAGSGTAMPDGRELSQTMHISLPVDVVWSALRDPRAIADCVPGARLTEVTGDKLRGEVSASLGPIQTAFAGQARVTYDDAARCVEVSGEGRDARTGTRLAARVTMQLAESGSAATLANIDISYRLQGALAQFVRGALVRDFAASVAASFAANLEAHLAGEHRPRLQHLPAGRLLWRALWQRLLIILGHRPH